MSWIQWQGDTWPITEDQAELRLHLWPPDSGYPRPSWNFDLFHLSRPTDAQPDDYEQDRWLSLAISDLFFHEPDWRRLSGREMRATPAWHEAHEHFHQHHNMVESRVTLSGEHLSSFPPGTPADDKDERWFAHDFILRFGTRDGLCFPCELDAWMIQEYDYCRTEPEDPAKIIPFASTPPNLRVITRALFTGGTVDVPRAFSSDPVAAAARLLDKAVAYADPLRETDIQWSLRHTPDRSEIIPMPGWHSHVQFATCASIYKGRETPAGG